MNSHLQAMALDLYAEDELSPAEVAEVEAHLRACALCQGRVSAARQMARALARLPRAEPAPDLAERVLATVRATHRRAEWPRAVAIGFGLAFSVLLLLALALDTLLAFQEGETFEFVSLLTSRPETVMVYPTEALSALWESLPAMNIVLTAGILMIGLILAEQFVAALAALRNHGWTRA